MLHTVVESSYSVQRRQSGRWHYWVIGVAMPPESIWTLRLISWSILINLDYYYYEYYFSLLVYYMCEKRGSKSTRMSWAFVRRPGSKLKLSVNSYNMPYTLQKSDIDVLTQSIYIRAYGSYFWMPRQILSTITHITLPASIVAIVIKLPLIMQFNGNEKEAKE